MLTEEEGPGQALVKLRKSQEKNLFSPLKCFYCTSVWVAFFVALAAGDFLLYWLPLSALAIFIEAVHDRLAA